MILLDLSPAEITGWDETAISRSLTKEMAKLDAVMLLARPLKAALPDAKHPGKAGKIPGGKLAFPLGLFPGFLWARSFLTCVFPSATSEKCFLFPLVFFCLAGSRGHAPGAGFRGRGGPCFVSELKCS